jgi:AraC-like DNA-binding protein
VSGRPVAGLTDQVVPGPAALGAGAEEYGADIAAAGEVEERVRIAERFVRARVPAPPADCVLVNGIVAAIESDRDILRVEDVCERFGIGKRRLQELFRELVGVPPKWVIQRYRLHEAAHRLDGGATRLAEVAADLGYADQAHFSRDFKRIVGVSPAGYARASAGG